MNASYHRPMCTGRSSISNSAVAARDPLCLCELKAKVAAAKT